MLMLRANALMKGYSGVRPELIRLLVEMFNRGVTPAVPNRVLWELAGIWFL